MVKKLSSILLLLCAVSFLLLAANFWDTKPYTEWTDKEIEKLIQDSPWGDRMAVRTGERGVVASVEGDAKGTVMGELEVQVTVLWQTALPIRQALARAQFKDDAGKAKELIERQSDVHVLRVTGLPGTARAFASNKEQLTADTVIRIKNKPDLKPTDIQMGGAPAPAAQGGGGKGFGGGGKGFGGGGNIDLFYVFPKSAGITEADNELEFISKLGKVTVRKKFKLKDMVFNGKFEM